MTKIYNNYWQDALHELACLLPLVPFRSWEYTLPPERPRKFFGQSVEYLALEFSEYDTRNWAGLSDFVDGPLVGNGLALYITLNADGIDRREFNARYPDVPVQNRYLFILAHEVGHALRGSTETAADDFAFELLGLEQDIEAKSYRDGQYVIIHEKRKKLRDKLFGPK